MTFMEFLPWMLAYIALGCIGGFSGGLLGIGGGMIYVPILSLFFEMQGFHQSSLMHIALGTSLTAIIFTSISSARAHHTKNNVDWSIVKRITPGIVIGGIVGGILARYLHTQVLAMIFAVFVTYSALQMFLNAKPKPSRTLPGATGLASVGVGISTLSQLVGAGGGFLSVPFMTWCNIPMHRAIGTSAAIGLPIAIVGAISFMASGMTVTQLPAYSAGFVYLPALLCIIVPSMLFAPVGARLAAQLPVTKLKRVFAIFLFVLALKMLYTALA